MQGPLKDVYQAALGLGTANQLTNILRDVGEDATERNRIYVPTQELKEFGISESEVSCSTVLHNNVTAELSVTCSPFDRALLQIAACGMSECMRGLQQLPDMHRSCTGSISCILMGTHTEYKGTISAPAGHTLLRHTQQPY